MRFLRAGSGPSVILLHGLFGYSFSWRYLVPALSPQATVYAPDMLGSGFSSKPQGIEYSLQASAKRLLRFLDAAEIETCDLVGTSHGGAVAMMAAALAPERWRRLVLVAPVNPWSAHGRSLAPVLSTRLVSTFFLWSIPGLRWTYKLVLRRLYGDPRRIRPQTLAGYSAPLSGAGDFHYAFSALRSWNRDLQELQALLPRIAGIPALLIWGSKDTAVNPASAVILRKCFKHCRVEIFKGVGHLPYEEVPDEFNRLVAEFLRPIE